MRCLPSAVSLSPFLSSLNPERNFLTPKQNLKKVNSLAQGLAVTRGRAGAPLEWLRLTLELYAHPRSKGLRYCSCWLPSQALTVTPVLKCLGTLKFTSDAAPSSSRSTSLLYVRMILSRQGTGNRNDFVPPLPLYLRPPHTHTHSATQILPSLHRC